MDAVAAMGAMAMDAMAGGRLNSALHDGRALVGAAREFMEIAQSRKITVESYSLHGRCGRDGRYGHGCHGQGGACLALSNLGLLFGQL